MTDIVFADAAQMQIVMGVVIYRKLGIAFSMFCICKECLRVNRGVNCGNPQHIEISEDDVLKEVDEDMDIIQLNTEEI